MKAFPSSEPIYRDDIVGIKENSGMDLRDYFAAKAMQELLRWDLNMPHSQQSGLDWLGKYSYVVADTLIKARNAK